jgi:methionyl-tRNA synthetase
MAFAIPDIHPAILATIAVWDGIWKGIGMWKSARNNQLKWFVAILIVNSVGILPMIYMKWFQKKVKKRK